MLGRILKLKKAGVLSLNQRNADFVLRYNKRHLYPIVDNKLKTKKLALDAGLSVPELYAVIDSQHQIASIEKILTPHANFVIKPAFGAGGDGIIVIRDKVKGFYRKESGQLLSIEDIRYHLSSILAGAYSLGGHNDSALIEHKVIPHPVFSSISYHGVPDIRILVFKGYPIMAMTRLPTRLSEGKANLHQGAIGVGIDITSGRTLEGVLHNSSISFHPDTLNDLAGLQTPCWQEILHIAAKSYELTQLGYLGVDIVLDKDKGPMMLELNARPGLNIQIANQKGLLPAMNKVKNHLQSLKSDDDAQKRVEFSQNL